MSRKLFLAFVLMLSMMLAVGSAFATVQAGIFGAGNVLTVKASTSASINGVFSGVNVTVRWLTSYAVTLGTPTSIYGIAKQGGVSVNGLYSYQTFGAAPVQSIAWGASSENDLFTVAVNGGIGTGTFEVSEVLPGTTDDWYFEALGTDLTNTSTPFYAPSVANIQLPIQLTSFTAALLSSNKVTLSWSTASETNNFGFWIQKSSSATGVFSNVNSAIIAGHGTSTEQHSYSYAIDAAGAGDQYYRLQQVDLDGAVHYTDAVKANVTSVDGKTLPTVFALNQNYPNPFNPSTVIEFALPKESRVKIDVYNIIGAKVATLVDEIRSAGFYSEKFEGKNLASGIYFYRMSTNETSFLKKMMLLK